MAPLRKPSNGRSPLVNPKRQITCFFSKVNSSSPFPASELFKGETIKSNPNPKSPSPSHATPPLGSNTRKTFLDLGETPSPSPSPSTPGISVTSHGEEVVGRRIRVYWPTDKIWLEGCVKLFYVGSGKHFVEYDDFGEGVLDLGKEKIEWVEESVKKFKRLRRGSLAFKKTVIEDEEMEGFGCAKEDNGGGGNSNNTNWENSVGKENSDLEDCEDDGMVKARKEKSRLGRISRRKERLVKSRRYSTTSMQKFLGINKH